MQHRKMEYELIYYNINILRVIIIIMNIITK